MQTLLGVFKCLIITNIEKPLSFHKNNLEKITFFQKTTESNSHHRKQGTKNFPQTSNIQMTFQKQPLHQELKDIQFCYKFVNFINLSKKTSQKNMLHLQVVSK